VGQPHALNPVYPGNTLVNGQTRPPWNNSQRSQHTLVRNCRSYIWAGVTVLVVLILCKPAGGQSKQFWPEVNVYKKLNSHSRFHFITQLTRENEESTEMDLGVDLDFYLKPMVRLGTLGGLPLDESKSRPLLLRLGYHYMPSTQGPTEHRAIFEATPRFPLKAGAVISSRNRLDFRFIDDEFSWRYRNRLSVERTFTLPALQLVPYVRAEVYYDHKHTKWTRTTFSGGVAIPFKKHYELDTYFEHQNDTSKSPNRQVNALGIALNLYF